jgi:hypothetical protein
MFVGLNLLLYQIIHNAYNINKIDIIFDIFIVKYIKTHINDNNKRFT